MTFGSSCARRVMPHFVPVEVLDARTFAWFHKRRAQRD
jgi:hypothetical protein